MTTTKPRLGRSPARPTNERGAMIFDRIKAKGLTLSQFCGLAGITFKCLRSLLHNPSMKPHAATARVVASALDVEAGSLAAK